MKNKKEQRQAMEYKPKRDTGNSDLAAAVAAYVLMFVAIYYYLKDLPLWH